MVEESTRPRLKSRASFGLLTENIGGFYELFRLGVISGFRFRGAYWKWRLHTAFGRSYPASRLELLRSILAYGRWMHRMRRSG